MEPMPQPTGVCPHCGGPAEYQNVRYPQALCHACDMRVTDLSGRLVTMFNVAMSGGFAASHCDDGTPCAQVTADGRVLVDGVEFRAGEAHMGGIVVQPMR
jgi:hypothetical protein